MFNYVKNSLSKLIKSRLIVLVVLFALLAGILIQRLYTMQIINGEKYLTDFTMQIKKETTLKSTRGNIYDRDGNAVAYNKLAYNVTYDDVGSYDTTRERNLAMNGSLYQIMKVIEDGGDQVYTNYAIDIGSNGQYEFTREGFNLLRFRADIFGYADTEDLKTDERNCTAEEMMQTLSTTIEAKDEYTRGHSHRVAEYAALIAEELGWDKKEIKNLKNAAHLHDIGKICIPDNILNKPTRLTEEEFQVIKEHTVIGAEILKNITLISHVKEVARSHHERYDGMGYPDGLKGEEIPLYARVITVADSYDAMKSRRIYRNPLDDQIIYNEIARN